MIYTENNKLIYQYDNETLCIEAWGKNSLRIRATCYPHLEDDHFALLPQEPPAETNRPLQIQITDHQAFIRNGNIKAVITRRNTLQFYNQQEQMVLEEYIRQRAVEHDSGNEDVNVKTLSAFSCTLKLKPREFRPIPGGDYRLTVRFEAAEDEKIFGMGQYQEPWLNLKNCKLELAQRNSQSSVPFYLSSKGYGFLWNNPGIGYVNFARNITEWVTESTRQLDYWITVADSPAEIEESYASVTGTVPMMPDFALGLWQSKMRYQTQQEVLDIARQYQQRGILPSVLVIDFFHWTEQGHFDFDRRYWPDPAAMVNELKAMGIEPMISVWPTLSVNAGNYQHCLENGYLVRCERGVRVTMQQLTNTVFFDLTNPHTRDYLWRKLKENYYDIGIKNFWLDVAEPGYMVYDFDNYRYYEGSSLQVANKFPRDYARLIYDGLQAQGEQHIVSLIRCAWAGSQRYGALAWSGDIDSSFQALRNQINSGLNMGIAGIPWWTTDIGGFHGGHADDEEFRELMIRWFQYATFCPVLRMHGDRQPHSPPLGSEGAGQCASGAANEIWSYGAENEALFIRYIRIRTMLRDYIRHAMRQAHQRGTPVIRPLFYDFPDDKTAWDIDYTYMFGPDILIAPVIYYQQRQRQVYLPAGANWVNAFTRQHVQGGQTVMVQAPLAIIPVFYRDDAAQSLPDLSAIINHTKG